MLEISLVILYQGVNIILHVMTKALMYVLKCYVYDLCSFVFLLGKKQSTDGAIKTEGSFGSALCRSLLKEG